MRKYNFFDGNEHRRRSRRRSHRSRAGNGPPAHSPMPAPTPARRGADFADPLDAIAARFRPEARRRAVDRFTPRSVMRWASWASRTIPICTRSAGAIRNLCAATTPTATAATAAMKEARPGDRGLADPEGGEGLLHDPSPAVDSSKFRRKRRSGSSRPINRTGIGRGCSLPRPASFAPSCGATATAFI